MHSSLLRIYPLLHFAYASYLPIGFLQILRLYSSKFFSLPINFSLLPLYLVSEQREKHFLRIEPQCPDVGNPPGTRFVRLTPDTLLGHPNPFAYGKNSTRYARKCSRPTYQERMDLIYESTFSSMG